jgi:hypothetical protein
VAEDLAKSFVDLPHVALAPHRVAKLPLIAEKAGYQLQTTSAYCNRTATGLLQAVYDGQSNSTKWSETA